MWWNKPDRRDRQMLSSGLHTTRRTFVSAIVGASIASARGRNTGRISTPPADITLRIERARIDVAPGHTITTATYNGTAPGPLIRLNECVPASVHIMNRTDVPEYIHWHGFEIAPELDGTEEEGSLVVPPGGELQYEITPHNSGSRYVHSHA